MISAKEAKLLERDDACRQIIEPIPGVSWDQLQDFIETKNRRTFSPDKYHVGKVFACPDFSSEHGYFLCAVTAYDPRTYTGTVTFFRPTAKPGVFSLFPMSWSRETIEFNALRNGLVPIPFVKRLAGGRIRLLYPLRSQLLTYIEFAHDEADADPSKKKLHMLARLASTMKH